MVGAVPRRSQPWICATDLPAIAAGVSGWVRNRARSSRNRPKCVGDHTKFTDHAPRVRSGLIHPLRRNSLAVSSAARPVSWLARSSTVTISAWRACRSLRTPTRRGGAADPQGKSRNPGTNASTFSTMPTTISDAEHPFGTKVWELTPAPRTAELQTSAGRPGCGRDAHESADRDLVPTTRTPSRPRICERSVCECPRRLIRSAPEAEPAGMPRSVPHVWGRDPVSLPLIVSTPRDAATDGSESCARTSPPFRAQTRAQRKHDPSRRAAPPAAGMPHV